MPRKDKISELKSWLNSSTPFIFSVKVDNYNFKVMVDDTDLESAKEKVLFKYRNMRGIEVTCEGRVSHFIL